MAKRKLGEILVMAGVIDELQLQSALGEQRKWGRPLGDTLVEMGLIAEESLVNALSAQLNFPGVNLDNVAIPPEVLNYLDHKFCLENGCIPFGYDEQGAFLDVAMADPTNPALFDQIRVRTRCNLRPYVGGPRAIEKAIRYYYLGEKFEAKIENRPWYTREDEVVFDFDGGDSEQVKAKDALKEPPKFKEAPAPPTYQPEAPAPPTYQPEAQSHRPRQVTGPVLPDQPERAHQVTTPIHPGLVERTRPVTEPVLPDQPPNPDPSQPTSGMSASARDELLIQLHSLIKQLRSQLDRDEKVLRKLMSLMVEKGVCTREELIAKIHES